MVWRELILVRVSDLEPGQRVRMPRAPNAGRGLQTVVHVGEDCSGSYVLSTDEGAYLCEPWEMISTEFGGEAR